MAEHIFQAFPRSVPTQKMGLEGWVHQTKYVGLDGWELRNTAKYMGLEGCDQKIGQLYGPEGSETKYTTKYVGPEGWELKNTTKFFDLQGWQN